MSRYSEAEYMYASAKLASLSGRLASPGRLQALCDARSTAELYDRLAELGVSAVCEGGSPDAEKTLMSYLSARYAELDGFIPDPEPLRIMRLRYDCHNLKTAVRCRYLGLSPDPFFIDCGNIPAAKVKDAAEAHDYSEIPGRLGEAARTADARLSESGNSRDTDVALDRACFEDMREAAGAFGFEPASRLLSLKIDHTNILTRLRIFEMTNPDAARLCEEDSFLDGGSIPVPALAACASGEELFAAVGRVLGPEFGSALAAQAASGNEAVSAFLDRCFLSEASACAGSSQLGAGPLLRYAVSLESSVRNMRIIISGVGAGTDPDTLRERLRL